MLKFKKKKSAGRHVGVDRDAEWMRGETHEEKQDIKDSNFERETETTTAE